MREKRYFTVEEANGYIPFLEEWLDEMRHLRRRLEVLEEEIGPVFERVYLDSGGPEASDFLATLLQLQAFERLFEEEGILLRDVESGLVDFPALRFEREVYLSWKSGEPRVEFWHETDTGLPGRKPLDELGEEDLKRRDSDADEI